MGRFFYRLIYFLIAKFRVFMQNKRTSIADDNATQNIDNALTISKEAAEFFNQANAYFRDFLWKEAEEKYPYPQVWFLGSGIMNNCNNWGQSKFKYHRSIALSGCFTQSHHCLSLFRCCFSINGILAWSGTCCSCSTS